MITFGPSRYSDIQVGFDDTHVVNVVLIKYLEKIKKGSKPTRVVEHDHTYKNADSVAKYGPKKKTFTVHKKIDFSAYADSVFAKNADPDPVPTSITVPVRSSSELLGGFQDGAFVGKQCLIILPDGVTEYTARIERMTYTIGPTSWTVQVFLRAQNLIQRPRQTELKTEVGNNPDKAVLTDHLDDDAVTTAKISSNAVTGTELNNSIDASTITVTAGTFQTVAGVGIGTQGMKMSSDTSGGVLKFWTGHGSETGAGWINPTVANSTPSVEIASPATSAGRSKINVWPGEILLTSDLVFTSSNFTCGARVVANQLEMDGPPTTSSSANVFVGSGGLLNKVTSLSKFKIDQESLSVEAVRGILDVTPKTWFDRAEVEENGGSTDGLRRIPGVVAEDVEEHAPQFATYDGEGNLQGVAYDRLAAGLIPLVREQREEIAALKGLVADLVNVVSLMTDRLDALEAGR